MINVLKHVAAFTQTNAQSSDYPSHLLHTKYKMEINLSLLEPDAIRQLHQNLQYQLEEMNQARFNMTKIAELLLDAKLTLEQVKDTKEEDDLELLVPMSGMMYVKGKLIRDASTLIDVGQDIFIEKK